MKNIVLLFLLVLCSCSNNNELNPVDIHYGQDICERCKMIISEERFSSQMILKNGEVYNFDDIGGMITYVSENKINPETTIIYVKDFNTKKWLTSDEAVFISLENINSPMNFGLIAVSDMDTANNILSAHKGKITGSFADTINIIRYQQ